MGEEGIANERGFYVAVSGKRHPVTFEDYGNWWARGGLDLHAAAESNERSLSFYASPVKLPLSPDQRAGAAGTFGTVGMFALAAGPDVYVADMFGLGDPLGSRVLLPPVRERPGHEKYLSPPWFAARLAAEDAPVLPDFISLQNLRAAEAALDCPPVRELLSAVQDKLTVGRAVRNVSSPLSSPLSGSHGTPRRRRSSSASARRGSGTPSVEPRARRAAPRVPRERIVATASVAHGD